MVHQWKQRLASLSAFGSEAELSAPRVELCANKQAVIEGCAGMVEYSETHVRLNCKTIVLELEGFELCLDHLSSSQLCVSGQLTLLRFLQV